MSESLSGLDRTAAAMRKPISEFAELVRDLAGAKALTLFGAVTTESFDATRQTARSVLVVDRVDLSVLRGLAEHGAKLGKVSIAAPLVMTPDYITDSLDTFPLELLEIMQKHVTLFGDDHFVDLSFEDAHVRLQCERELKVILIGLRQGLLAAAGREKFIGALEMDVGEGLSRTLRGLLWLKGRKDARPIDAVLTELEKVADRKLSGVRAAMDPTAEHGWMAFEKLYEDVEALGSLVDGW
ncbi:MAG: hypothetical protein IH989_02580 [Planctomycetes bacterium]|nr:hypothetical protein [Planctomycetota bacterium]